MENKEKKRAHLHKKQERELKNVHNLIEKEKKLKKGSHLKLSTLFDGSFLKRGAPRNNVDGGSLTNLHIPKKMGIGKSLNATHFHIEKGNKMKKGGYYKKDSKMHQHNCYAHGGSVYEHEMVGEHPTHSFHHYDYEGMMRGERPMHRAHDPEHSHPETHVYRHGGHQHESHRKKYAAGGVAKIRHNAMSVAGHPIHRHSHSASAKVKVY